MSELVRLEGVKRREVIRSLALAMTGAGVLDLEAAQHVHAATAVEKSQGSYRRKALTEHEFRTVTRLAELIVPKDEVSGSGAEAGAPEFIDTLAGQNATLAEIYHGGLAWLDAEMRKRYGATFVGAKASEQEAMLDLLVAEEQAEARRREEELVYRRSEDYKGFSGYTVKRASELGVGVKFFDWVRKMTVDAFYTSAMGIKDLGFRGNRAWSSYRVPEECIDYALKRSPFAGG
jgi:hypothetical protein